MEVRLALEGGAARLAAMRHTQAELDRINKALEVMGASFRGGEAPTGADWEFHSALEDPLDDLLALHAAACARSRAAVEGRDLDEPAAASEGRPFTVRFAFLHLIEETARHAGHADLLREAIDGRTGE